MKKSIFLLLFMIFTVNIFALEIADHPYSHVALSKKLISDIVLRFYHIQRLHKGVRRLVKLSKKKLVPLALHCYVREVKNKKVLILDNDVMISFTHPRIIWCLEHIEQYNSLGPFLEVWDDLGHYQLVSDTAVIREFTYLVFYLYKKIVHQECLLQDKKEEIEKFDALFKSISSLDEADLENILNILDIVIDELPVFVEQYELTSNLTWKEWAKKHWMFAPIAASIIAIKIYTKINSLYSKSNNTIVSEYET